MLKKLIKKLFRTAIILFILGIAAIFGFFYAVKGGAFGDLPTDQELKDIRNFQASDIYSQDNQLLGRYFSENRTHIDIEDVSPNIINALISTEDSRFYSHAGIDQIGLMRVLFKSIILGQRSGGGSTISQQLIKNLFGREKHGVFTMPVAKIKEGVLANKLNELYSKNEILELYLNTVSFGEDTYGIGTAAERFFSTNTKDIRLQEAAVLIGMLKAPTTYNPRMHPEKSLTRRNTVLALMKRHDHLSEDKFNQLKNTSIELKYKREDINEGTAAYFRNHIKGELNTILAKTTNSNGKPYQVNKDGLKIYTTIDSRIQQAAEKAITKHANTLTRQLRKEWRSKIKNRAHYSIVLNELKKSNRYIRLESKKENEKTILETLKKRMQTSIFTFKGKVDTLISPVDSVIHTICLMQSTYMAMNPSTGELLAYVGGVNYKYFPYDRTQAERQVGSIFKPIIYSNALNNGVEICDPYKNSQIKYTQYGNWTPRNSDGKYGGKYTLAGALTNSVNTVSVQLLMERGINQTIDYCHELGITDSLPRVPSLALGVASLPLSKMIEVYSVFANEGKKQSRYCIERIENNKGEVIYKHEKTLPSKVLEKSVTDKLTRMLQSVVDSGTGQRLRSRYHFKEEIAGKTGTTQNQTDGWFMGYTPTFLAGVWTGADVPSIRFASIREGQGANMALPVWAEVFKTVKKHKDLKRKHITEFDHEITIDCNFYIPEKTGLIHNLFKRKGAKINESDGLETKSKTKRKKFFDKWK